MIGDGIVLTEEVAGYPAGTEAVIRYESADIVGADINGQGRVILELLHRQFRMETFADTLKDGEK